MGVKNFDPSLHLGKYIITRNFVTGALFVRELFKEELLEHPLEPPYGVDGKRHKTRAKAEAAMEKLRNS